MLLQRALQASYGKSICVALVHCVVIAINRQLAGDGDDAGLGICPRSESCKIAELLQRCEGNAKTKMHLTAMLLLCGL